MSGYPPEYSPATDFSQKPIFEKEDLDPEFDALATTIEAIRALLAAVARDDWALRDGIVRPESLSAAVRLLLSNWTFRGDWATATAYAARDVVYESNLTYVCIAAHTSTVFASDAANWQAVGAVDGSDISFAPAGSLSSTDVQAAIEELDAALTGHGHTAYVTKALYDANTILAATTDNTPAALTVPAASIVGRESSGNIKAMTAAEAKGVLGLADAALKTAANTWTATQIMPDGSGIDSPAGQNSGPVWYTGGIVRWQAARNGLAESGVATGSHWTLFRYDNSGNFLGTVIEVRRSDGSILLESASGGFQGTGTVNAQGIYLNGESVLHEGAVFESSEQTITANTILTVPHGLGARPRFAFARLRCKTAEHNHAVGDETDGMFHDGTNGHNSSGPMHVRVDATNCYMAFGGSPLRVVDQLASASADWVSITNANWRVVFRAYL